MRYAIAEKEPKCYAVREPGFLTYKVDQYFEEKDAPSSFASEYSPLPSTKDYLDFSAADYLGLTQHPTIMDITMRAMMDNHSPAVNQEISVLRFEKKIAKLLYTDSSIFVQSGWSANLNLLQAVADSNLPIYIDHLANLSIRQAIKNTHLTAHVYDRHTPDALATLIEKHGTGIIMIDALSSIDGSIAPLPDIANLASYYDCLFVVDESHSIGIYGQGRSLTLHFELENKVHFITADLNKVFCNAGGIIAGLERNIEFVRHETKELNVISPTFLEDTAKLSATLNIIQKDSWRRVKLHSNANYLRSRLAHLGFQVSASQSHIVNILLENKEKAAELHNALMKRHIFSELRSHPVTPKKYTIIRFIVNARHNKQQLDQLLTILEEILSNEID